VATTRRLLDAIDEEGRRLTRAELLRGLRPLPPALLTEYTGRYRLIADSARAAGLALTIEADSLGLTVRRGDRPPERLHALAPTIFIRHGVRGFRVFERDGAGVGRRVVRRVVNWRDNNALVWGK
jgi:hypothetical protein